MYGRYPRSVRLEYTNPIPGKEDEFNYWYNYIHVPDILSIGVFDRVYRYKAIGEAKSEYLSIWESDFVDLKGAMGQARDSLDRLKTQGRLWPVSQPIETLYFFATGPSTPYNRKPVTFLYTAYTNCGNPGREDEFNQWYDELHLKEFLDTGYCHTAYRHERYDKPQEGEGRFLGIYESDVDLANQKAFASKIREQYRPIWYEPLGGPRLMIKQQQNQPSRPRDLVLESLRAEIWLPVWPSVDAMRANQM